MIIGSKPSLFGAQLYGRLSKIILLAATASTTVLLIFIIFLAETTRTNALVSIGQALDVQNQLILSNAREGLNLTDYVAKQARAEWLESGRLRPHAAQIEGMPNYQGAIVQIAVIDSNGYLAASSLNSLASKVYLGDRGHFIALKDALEDKIYISKPVIGRVSGKETVQFVRPIFSLDKKFAGVVVVSLDTKIFLALEIKALMNAGTFVELLGEDNVTRFGSMPDTASHATLNTPVEPSSAILSGKIKKMVSDNNFLRTTVISDFPLKLVVGKSSEKSGVRVRNIYLYAAIACVVIMLAAFLFTTNIIRLISTKQILLRRLELSNVKANSANEMKSKFVSGISHELRTPLNGILGFSELAKLSGSVEESRQYNEVIFESAQRLHQLVNTLLDLAKIEAGQIRLTTTVVNTADFFESIVGLYRDDAEKKSLVLNLTVNPAVPPTMLIDRIMVMQVIDNLIGNAVKFTETGVIFLDVEKVKKSWFVKIIDTGIGMTQEQIHHAFERFGAMQLYDSTVIANQGAGLGLALCKELLDLMEGTIDIQSDVGVGTTVTVTFKENDD
jgi:signal transduction histidine kinase